MVRYQCAIVLSIVIGSIAGSVPVHAGGGYYALALSGSSTDPLVNNPPNPGDGLQSLYLWSLAPCFPGAEDPGWLAAEFKIATTGTGWEILGFAPDPVVFDAGFPADSTGKNLRIVTNIASRTCGPADLLLGELFVWADAGPGVLEFAHPDCPSPCRDIAVVVDCSLSSSSWAWPEFVRFVGFATRDAGPNQDEGSGCSPVPVEPTSWGRIKSLYGSRP